MGVRVPWDGGKSRGKFADPSVADVSSVDFDVIEGKQPGDTAVHLVGRWGAAPSVALAVSDELVAASMLVARVVTAAAWSAGGEPSPQYSFWLISLRQ